MVAKEVGSLGKARPTTINHRRSPQIRRNLAKKGKGSDRDLFPDYDKMSSGGPDLQSSSSCCRESGLVESGQSSCRSQFSGHPPRGCEVPTGRPGGKDAYRVEALAHVILEHAASRVTTGPMHGCPEDVMCRFQCLVGKLDHSVKEFGPDFNPAVFN